VLVTVEHTIAPADADSFLGLAAELRRVRRRTGATLWHLHRDPDRCQSGYSSFRQVRGSAGGVFGVRSSRKLKYGATKGSGADTV
jgi:hypothetical protein